MSDTDKQLRERIIEAIRTVKDPEIPINLYDLGLIYDLEIDEGGNVAIEMTLTTPNCPVAEQMPVQVRDAVRGVEGVDDVAVTLVWEPAWTGERMTDDARMTLEMMGISWKDPRSSVANRPTELTLGKTARPPQRRRPQGDREPD